MNLVWFDVLGLIWYIKGLWFTLRKIYSIWIQTVQSITERLDDKHNSMLLNKLSNYGIKFTNFGMREGSLQSQKLSYMRFASSLVSSRSQEIV